MRRPGYASVMSTVALFVALGGTGYAAVTLAPNSVGTRQLKNSAVTTRKIAAGAVGAAQIASHAVTTAKIANHAVGASQIANHAVGASQIASGGVGTAQIANGAVGTAQIAPGAVTTGLIAPASLTAAQFRPGVLPTAFEAWRDGGAVFGTAGVTVATLANLPAGTYALSAKTDVFQWSGSPNIVTCTLTAGGDFDKTQVSFATLSETTLPMQVVHTFVAPGSATVACVVASGSSTPQASAQNTKIVAISLAGATTGSVSG
jgi:hypothetical protein